MFTGTGTAGAYHAGVLRALHEAGVRVDLVAGRGMGVMAALFAAVDLAPKLWDERGVWRDARRVAHLYRWRWPWRVLAATLAAMALSLLVPLGALLVVGFTYPIALVLQLVAGAQGAALARRLQGWAALVQDPAWFGVWVPRLVTLCLIVGLIAVVTLRLREQRRTASRASREGPWWRALGAPLDGAFVARWIRGTFWRQIRGAASIAEPTASELGRRYAELLGDNLGQPGYRELMIVAHDVDARRDLVFALLAEPHRRTFFGAAVGEVDARLAELVDLAGVGSRHVSDAIAAAVAVPLATEPHLMTHAVEGFWRGEAHHVHDRPAAIVRLLEELSAAGVEQVLLVSADPSLGGPHALRPAALSPRARFGEWIATAETASVRDATTALFDRFSGLFQIRPHHNPLGPFDFGGVYDVHSDRRFDLRELMARGYEDTYRQFIDPIVGEGNVTDV